MTAETGLQSGMVTSLGYAAGLRVDAIDRTLMPFAQATLLVAKPDLHDYAFRAGSQVSLVTVGWFDLSTQLAFEVAGTENSIYRGTALRTDLVLLAGHYGRRWFAVGEAGYDRAWLTYIKNSDWYRTNFYSDARDGWYSGTGGMLHAGAKGGVTIGRGRGGRCAPASTRPRRCRTSTCRSTRRWARTTASERGRPAPRRAEPRGAGLAPGAGGDVARCAGLLFRSSARYFAVR